MKDPNISMRQRLDKLGLLLAGFCALHCVATIIVVSVLGIGGHFLLEPMIHEIGLLLAFVFAFFAIGWGAIVHRRTAPVVIAIAGLGFMGSALMMPHGQIELVLTIIGVALVAISHLMNMRASRKTAS